MKSICSKNACKVDGSKPIMITAAAASNAKQAKKKMSEENESDDDLYNEILSDEEDIENSDSDDDNNADEEIVDPKETAAMTQKFLLPPTPDDVLNGKWFSVAYAGKKRRRVLLVGKMMERIDLGEGKYHFMMKFLKPKVGSGDILDDCPAHLPDFGMFLHLTSLLAPLM